MKEAVQFLITIKGITPFTALAFLTDVGDIERFKKQKKMNAYLGLVPKGRDSGGKNMSGHINRASRKLTRTILTQSINHVKTYEKDLKNMKLREKSLEINHSGKIISSTCRVAHVHSPAFFVYNTQLTIIQNLPCVAENRFFI